MRLRAKVNAAAPRIAVIIPAGGVGARFGSRTPKQFLKIQRVPVVTKTVSCFARYGAVTAIAVAAPEAHVERTRRALSSIARRAPLVVVCGGPTRQESVWLAMQAVPDDAEIIVVHDAVRPLITRDLIASVVRAAAEHGAAICALPIAETVKRVRNDVVDATLDRSELWAVQTPQAFRAALLREAHEKARRDGVVGTDDAMLVERLGHAVRVVRGLAENVKITTPEDLRRARGARRR
jgi:2-C-methyl-D-erythritol 4-phosphate cytidylyltransferase